MEQIIDKFRSLVAYACKELSKAKTDQLIQELGHLEKVKDMMRVIELMVP